MCGCVCVFVSMCVNVCVCLCMCVYVRVNLNHAFVEVIFAWVIFHKHFGLCERVMCKCVLVRVFVRGGVRK